MHIVKKIMMLLLIGSASHVCKAFELVNQSGSTLTLVLDYTYKPSFDIIVVGDKQPTRIDYGLTRIIAYKGNVTIRNSTNNGRTLAKKEALSFLPGRSVLSRIMGQVGAAHHTSHSTLIDDALHSDYNQQVPKFKIIKIGNDGLALWRDTHR